MRLNRYLYIISLTLILVISCTAGDTEFEEKFNRAMEKQKNLELFNSLLSLDQQYPNKLALKVNIGGMLLAAGDIQRAAVYLEEGHKLVKKSKDRRLNFLLFTNLAELSYRKKEYLKGSEYAEKALNLELDDQIGVLFTRAKCLLKIGEENNALEAFNRGWQQQRDIINREDINIYLALLLKREEYRDALAVIKHYETRFGYEPDLGVMESAIFERLGHINQGILAAFKELEYQKYRGPITSAEQIERLVDLEEKLPLTSWNPQREGEPLIKGLKLYAAGNFEEAGNLLKMIELDEYREFHRYLILSAGLESGRAALADYKSYIALESFFRALPAYYYHLWQGMKKNRGNYNIGTARNVLEKCILLAPETSFATETRIELGRLLGLESSDGKKILLGPELDALHKKLSTAPAAPAEILGPVLDLIATPDNVYQLAAVLMLKEAKRIDRVQVYLAARHDHATGRLKERLNIILR